MDHGLGSTCQGFDFLDLGIVAYGSEFRVSRDRVRIEDRGGECGFRIQVLGFRFQGSGFRFQVSSFRFQDLGVRTRQAKYEALIAV